MKGVFVCGMAFQFCRVLKPNPYENILERYHWLIISCVKLVCMFGLHLEFE